MGAVYVHRSCTRTRPWFLFLSANSRRRIGHTLLVETYPNIGNNCRVIYVSTRITTMAKIFFLVYLLNYKYT